MLVTKYMLLKIFKKCVKYIENYCICINCAGKYGYNLEITESIRMKIKTKTT